MKIAGIHSEVLNTLLNPVANVGTPIGLLAAALTKKRTDAEQAEAEKETWKNALIPGRSAYNIAKRIGRGGIKEQERSQIKEAYIQGFVKKAYEYGLPIEQALALLKEAAKDTNSDYHLYADDYRRTAKMVGLSDSDADNWYKKHYDEAKKMSRKTFAKEMKRVHYNRGYDKVDG
jgi:hypothetical protein